MSNSCQNLPKISQQRPRSKTTAGKPGEAKPLHKEHPKQVSAALLGVGKIVGNSEIAPQKVTFFLRTYVF